MVMQGRRSVARGHFSMEQAAARRGTGTSPGLVRVSRDTIFIHGNEDTLSSMTFSTKHNCAVRARNTGRVYTRDSRRALFMPENIFSPMSVLENESAREGLRHTKFSSVSHACQIAVSFHLPAIIRYAPAGDLYAYSAGRHPLPPQ